MYTNRSFLRRAGALIFVAGMLLQGCSSDSDSPTYPGGPAAIGGYVSKGPIAGAVVAVHSLQANGTLGSQVVGPDTTDALGYWAGEVPTSAVAPFVLAAAGGTYDDESTGNPVSLIPGQVLYGLVKGASSQVTPLSHTTFIGMQYLVSGSATLTDAINQATASSVTAFGFDFATTVPRNSATATDSEKRYAALLGGLSTLIDNNPALSAFSTSHPVDLILGLARDMADGHLDGLDPSGSPIDVPTSGPGTLAALLPGLSVDDLSAWLDACNTYAASQANLSGISFNTALVWAAAGSPGSGNCEVTFTGTGAALLPEACFDETSSALLKEQFTWNDGPDDVQILAILVTPTSNLFRTLYVTRPDNGGAVWNAFNGSGIPGVSLSGGVVTFTNVVLPELTSGGTSLTLNGQLDEPSPSAPAP